MMKKIILFIVIITLYGTNVLNAVTLWSENFATGTANFNTISNFTRNAGSTYSCVLGDYVIYTNSSNAYGMTKEFAVPQGKSIKLSFDSRRKNATAGVIKVFYNIGGQCSFSTTNNYQNGWVEWGSITPNTSVASPGGCTNQNITLTNEICGGQIVSVVLYCPNASSTNWISIDNIIIDDSPGTTTAVPNISGATTYTESFTQQYWYGPVTTTYPNARNTGIKMPYHTLKTSSDAYVYLWTGGASSTLDHTGNAGDYKVGLYTGFEYCDNTGGAQIITKELNTSACAAVTATLRFDFLVKYPNPSSTAYSFVSDEDYSGGIYCPEVYYATGAPGGSAGAHTLTWIAVPVNYYFPTGKWMRATYKLPKVANLKIKIARGSAYIEYIDNIKVLCDDCSISDKTGNAPAGEASPAPSTDYTYTVGATAGASYYRWVIRKRYNSSGLLCDGSTADKEATLYWGAPASGNPGIVSGNGTQSVVINFGSCTDCKYTVMCIPYDANPGTFAAPNDACYAKAGLLSTSIVAPAPCVAPTVTAKANTTATSITICNGDNVDLTANPVGGSDCSGSWAYAWSTTDATEDVLGLTPAVNTTYTVTVVCDADAACSNTSQVIVNVNNAPTVTDDPIATTVCDGENTTLGIVATGATSYTWQVDDGLGGGFVNLTNGGFYSDVYNDTITITGDASISSFLYRCVAINACGSTPSGSAELTVNAIPAAPSGDNDSICDGGVVPDLAAVGTDLKWYDDAPLTNEVNTGATFATGETAVGTYTYYVTQTILGCESPSLTIKLKIIDNPAAPIGIDSIRCDAGDVNVKVTSLGNAIKWYDASSGGALLSSDTNYTDNIAVTTSYFAEATSASGCISARTEVQGIISGTVVTTLLEATGVSSDEFTAFWNSVSGAIGYWLDVSTDSTFLSFLAGYNNKDMSTDTTITISGLVSGTNYYYRVRVENFCGVGLSSGDIISVTTQAAVCRTYRKCIWEGDISTDWNTAANWKCDSIPTASDTVLIPTLGANFNPVIGVAPNATVDGICNSITIETGESLTINIDRQLVVKGDWTNNGSAELGEGEVVFSQGLTQYIRGANNWANIEFTNDVVMVAATGAQNLKGVMKQTAGTLYTNDQLTLLSVANPAPNGRTACIDGGAGEVDGVVTVQRYLLPPSGYKYLSVPTSDATVAQFSSDDIVVNAAYWNADYSKLGWANFWGYEESNIRQTLHPDPIVTDINQQIMMNGWKAPASPVTPMPPMKGYALYIDAGKVIDVVGNLNNGTQEFTLSYTSSADSGGLGSHDGWNLIGNPYPCPIDYSDDAAWDKSNILAPLYFFKPQSLYYGMDYMWVPVLGGWGVSIPLGLSPVIGAMQSFFIKTDDVSKNGTKLKVFNTARTPITNPNFYKKSSSDVYPYQLRLSIQNRISKKEDQTLIYFVKNATIGYDPQNEAFKSISDDPAAPFIYSKVKNFKNNETYFLAINAIPYPTEDIEIPLTVALRESNGSYIIKPLQMPIFNAGETVWLEDRIEGKMQNLIENPSYIINLPKGTHADRFFIIFKKSNITCQNTDNKFVNNIAVSTAKLNWTTVASAEKYMIRWREKNPQGTWNYYVANNAQTSLTIGNLKGNTTYEWQMRTLCFGELSYAPSFTELQEFKTTLNCSEIIVSGRNVTDITTSKAILKYYTVASATHYMIRYKEKNTANWKYLNVAGNIGAVQIGCDVCAETDKLKAGTTYEWQMRVFCAADNSLYSAFSSIIEFTTHSVKKKDPNFLTNQNTQEKNIELNVYPNPYKAETNIKYTLNATSNVKIEVQNLLGLKVATIVDKQLDEGVYYSKFSAKNLGLSSGIYIIKVQAGDSIFERKIIEIE